MDVTNKGPLLTLTLLYYVYSQCMLVKWTLTLALSLVHDLQVRMSHATGHKQSTLLLIGPSIAAAHSVLE